MNIFFNEKSLTERNDLIESEYIVNFFHDNIANQSKFTIHASTDVIKQWIDSWDLDEHTTKSLILSMYDVIDSAASYNDYYYHYKYLHTIENINGTSIAAATDKIIDGQAAVILNIPVSFYCQRNFIPVIKSSNNPNIQDQFVCIPCFNDSKKIADTFFLTQKIKPLINNNEIFEKFKDEYLRHSQNFDWKNWKPKTYISSTQLNAQNAFPACVNDTIKKELDQWDITKENTEQNITEYNRLGGIVLELHGYTRNPRLSSHYSYEVYEAGTGNDKLIISIDVENGAFEVMDISGTHIGAYGYAGNYIRRYTNQTKINKHSFSNIPKHMFLF